MATTQTRPEFIDTYWIIPEYSSAPYGKVSFTRQDRRTFIAMFKDSRLIWAGHQRVQDFTENVKRTESPKLPVEGTESRSQFNQSPGLLVRKMPHEGIEEISIPQGMVNISTFNPSHNEHRYSSGGGSCLTSSLSRTPPCL
ncbi:hypothetical protein [Sodalis glossinidius]|uniref:hypothetical protein n=1 Tax=Sodalis glossinidius TaxID=63612 RepID=UPI0011D0396A|nr:hypothetical protein [Sodalis glossinidius]